MTQPATETNPPTVVYRVTCDSCRTVQGVRLPAEVHTITAYECACGWIGMFQPEPT
ncbi:hypothetical protein [Actinoalloteichus sp. GBA129-24]|uniref:hypothetical protein n=1 Tax=Actinoalloteichus sp. GBA129-24 TaxID=1612551 RepID=UPI0009503671|nr:hypothetical protein [Actinoalloteichus sp. GBA129-24]APU20909.1 hypothetical protein UA75_14495 [Actinoalloteichus sp. GBA129-24]APU24158.1 hypothetical protein UA75_30975 [Actinoalloteichus sp. GBA129-24]